MDIVVVIVVSILGSSVLTATVTALFTRRNRKAEVESLQVQTAQSVVALTAGQFHTLQKEIDNLKLEVLDLKRRLNESDSERRWLRSQVHELHAHIDDQDELMREHGITPKPRPRFREVPNP